MSTILVLGATTGVGHEVARLLEAAGHAVRRATRTPRAPGDVAVDLAAGAGLDAAFAGADRAFLMVPAGYPDAHALLARPLDAARRHGLAKVVLMTAQGVDQAPPEVPFRRAELALEGLGVPHAILRPSWFMQNFATFWGEAVRAGRLDLPAGDARTGFIDARDIAAVAAALLPRDGTDGGLTLTGPESLTHEEAAAILGVRYTDVAPAAFEAGLVAHGVAPAYAALLGGLYANVRAGHAAQLTDAVEEVLGRKPRTLAAWAAENRPAATPAAR